MDIDITLKNYRCFSDENPARISLRKGCTAFVGVNNSGKSTLLKFFYEFRGLFRDLPQAFWAAMNGPRNFDWADSIADAEEVFCNTNHRDLQIEIEFNSIVPGENSSEIRLRIVLNIPRVKNQYSARVIIFDGKTTRQSFDGLNVTILISHGEPQADLKSFFEMCNFLTKTVYVGAFRNAINVGGGKYFDIQIGQQFISQWASYKAGKTKKHNVAATRLTEDIRRIFGFNTLEINASDDRQTLLLGIDGKPYRLEELGAGLAQFIIVLINIAILNPAYLLIDEPEINLHPRLQADFLTTLESYAGEGVLFATHNIGLARACAERIYSVRKVAEGKSEVRSFEATPRLSELLGELSFSGYRELGFNKVLLVEGRTDIKTFQQFLRKYRKDHEIVLLDLGGRSLINGDSEAELQEVKRITENISAVIDSERDYADAPLSPERSKFVETCEKVGINCKVLDRRATENYLSERAVRAYKGDKFKALGAYDDLKRTQPAWGKSENWHIAREMEKKELEGTDLGDFLNSL